MRNKGFFWTITIALIVATIYQLSFTSSTISVEKEGIVVAGEKIDSLKRNEIDFIISNRDTLYVGVEKHKKGLIEYFANAYVKSVANNEAHFTGATYAECQSKEVNLGLDLQGGMSVTLEISVPELVFNLAGKTKKDVFYTPYLTAIESSKNGEGDFIEIFAEEFEKNEGDVKLAKIFHRYNKDDLSPNATNEEVVEFLNNKASSALDGVETIIEKRVNQFGVAQPTIQQQKATNRIFVELPGVKDKETARKKLQATANLEFHETYDNLYDGIGNIIFAGEQALSKELFGDILGQDTKTTVDSTDATLNLDAAEEVTDALSLDAIVDSSKTEEVVDAAAEQDSLTAKQQRQLRPVTSYLALNYQFDQESGQGQFNKGAVVGFANVIDTSIINSRLNHPVFLEVVAESYEDLVFMWDAIEINDAKGQATSTLRLYAIKVAREGAPVNGKDIAKSSAEYDLVNGHHIAITMTAHGAEKWGELTGKNIGKPVAVTMDNLVFSAPAPSEKLGSRSIITGSFTMEASKDLAGLLNAGSLPAPAKIVDESTVGPTLGEDNITSGMWSFGFAILLVLIYMVFYYGKAGIIADIALIVNIFLLVGALSSIGAILTLPGIAGIVLTIGMSVDANVLIFERIKEELRSGKGYRAALEEGFNKAMAAILDANITTLLTGVVLAVFGSGPIKGFATTLIIGIFTSFFAAVVVSRLIFALTSDKGIEFKFSTGMTKNWFVNTNIAFVSKRKIFYVISGVVISIGLIFLFTKGLDKGVDFTGGRTYTVKFDKNIDINEIEASLTTPFESKPTVKTVGNSYTAAITTKFLVTDNSTDANQLVEDALKNGLVQFGTFEITASKMIAPTISKDLKTNSFYAIFFALVIIFLYIVIRFRKWQYGLGALLAMAHDVLVVLGLFAIFWGWIGFSMEIDQAFIAAILTVVGYSINDTVVVFDRIREYLHIHPMRDKKENINSALNSTMGRTINTSVSTFVVLLVIFLFGGESIKGFTFALMIGVVVGTYSSLFIATPAVIDFEKKNKENK
jgi:SecD/SecF fusion protein